MMSNDIECITFSEEDIRARVQEMGAEIAQDYRDAAETVYCVGILKGAAVFFTDLVRAIDRPVSFDFMIVSSYGDAAVSSGQVKILKDLDFSIEGKHVIIVEDRCFRDAIQRVLKSARFSRSPRGALRPWRSTTSDMRCRMSSSWAMVLTMQRNIGICLTSGC